MGPLSNNHALKVYADSEEAVGILLRQADVGRPAKIDKSSDGQSIRVAESAIRKIKDAAAAFQTSLREQGVDRLSQKKKRIKNKIVVSLAKMQHLPPPDAVAVPAEDTAAKDPAAVWFHYVSLKILIVVLLVVVLLFCCFAVEALEDATLKSLQSGDAVAVTVEDATFLPLPSFLPRTCCIRYLYYCLQIKHLSSLLPWFLPSFIHSFLHSFLSFPTSFLPSFLHSFRPSFPASFLPSFLDFIFLDAK